MPATKPVSQLPTGIQLRHETNNPVEKNFTNSFEVHEPLKSTSGITKPTRTKWRKPIS